MRFVAPTRALFRRPFSARMGSRQVHQRPRVIHCQCVRSPFCKGVTPRPWILYTRTCMFRRMFMPTSIRHIRFPRTNNHTPIPTALRLTHTRLAITRHTATKFRRKRFWCCIFCSSSFCARFIFETGKTIGKIAAKQKTPGKFAGGESPRFRPAIWRDDVKR